MFKSKYRIAKLNGCPKRLRIGDSNFALVLRFEHRISDLAPKFLLAIRRSVRTLAVDEACKAIHCRYISARLLRSDWRGTGAFAG
jgi:hypothetical protein